MDSESALERRVAEWDIIGLIFLKISNPIKTLQYNSKLKRVRAQ
jgi:hypothetical protein